MAKTSQAKRRRTIKEMKKLLLIIAISIFSKNGFTEQKRPDYGKIAIDGMISGMTSTIKNMPKTIEIISNKINESPEKAKTWKKSVTCNKKGKECKTSYSD